MLAGCPEIYGKETAHCMCGAASNESHRVWIAWLNAADADASTSVSCIGSLLNWLTGLATGRAQQHCQIVLWDNDAQTFYTYSVDYKIGHVYVWHLKSFLREWSVVELTATAEQELAVRNFLVRQIGKPYNAANAIMWPFGGSSGRGRSWFCSELAAEALLRGALLDLQEWGGPGYSAPQPYSLAPHQLYDYFTTPGRCTTSAMPRQLANNPMMVRALVRDIAESNETLPPLLAANAELSDAGQVRRLSDLSMVHRANDAKRTKKQRRNGPSIIEQWAVAPQQPATTRPRPSILSSLGVVEHV